MEAAPNEPAAAGDVEVTHSPLEFCGVEATEMCGRCHTKKVRHNGGTRRAVRQRCQELEESRC